MLIPDLAYELLIDAGVLIIGTSTPCSTSVVERDDGIAPRHGGMARMQLKLPSGPELIGVEVKTYNRSLSQRALATAVLRARPGTALLLIAERLGSGVRDAAADLGVSVIGLHGESGESEDHPIGHVAIKPGQILTLTKSTHRQQTRQNATGKWSGRSLTVIRSLLLCPLLSQTELAAIANISQPRVSQVLARLANDNLASRNPPRALDWETLLDHWLSVYPGPGGVVTHWYGIAPPGDQSRSVVTLINLPPAESGGSQALVSGDVAADHLSPWGRAGHSVVYSRHGADLRAAKLTPCLAQDSSLTLIVPEDTGIWTMADRWWYTRDQELRPPGLPLADPLQILTDLYRSRTIDADQTAHRLRQDLRQQVIAANPAQEENRCL